MLKVIERPWTDWTCGAHAAGVYVCAVVLERGNGRRAGIPDIAVASVCGSVSGRGMQ